MTRTFSKIKSKRVSGQKQRGDTDSRSIKEDLEIIQTHPTTLNVPKKVKKSGHTQLFSVNLCTYATILGKLACTRDCESKTHVQEEKDRKIR